MRGVRQAPAPALSALQADPPPRQWEQLEARMPPDCRGLLPIRALERGLVPIHCRRDTARAMSQENVEIVREVIARFNRDGFLPDAHFDPDVELSNIRESPLPGPYRGYEGLKEWREGVFEVIEEGRFEIGDPIDVDEADLVIFKQRLLGRAKHTGLEMDFDCTTVFWFREGRIYRSESFTNHSEALEAAGLSE